MPPNHKSVHERAATGPARYLSQLLRERGHDRAWVVSQPFHLRRACRLFRDFGIEPRPHHAETSLQHTDPRLAARWIAREYASWLKYATARVAGALPRR